MAESANPGGKLLTRLGIGVAGGRILNCHTHGGKSPLPPDFAAGQKGAQLVGRLGDTGVGGLIPVLYCKTVLVFRYNIPDIMTDPPILPILGAASLGAQSVVFR